MIDITKHRVLLVKILKEIYSDPLLRTALGFKGGTAAYLFYDLPRFSVDLDFDLLEPTKKDEVLARCEKILSQFGKLEQTTEKRMTLFFLLSYEQGQRKIKLEISKRTTRAKFERREYLGIPVLVMKKEDVAAGKLSAFLTRKKFAARDLFDLWFFLKNDWEINKTVVQDRTGLSLQQALRKARKKIDRIKNTQLLQGIGELLDEKQKAWVKEKLKRETIFSIDFYLQEYKTKSS